MIDESDIKFKHYEAKYSKEKSFCIANNEQFNGKWHVGLDLYGIDGGFPVVLIFQDGVAKFKTESNPKSCVYFLDRPDKILILKSAQQGDAPESRT